jgi:hypothetical protein
VAQSLVHGLSTKCSSRDEVQLRANENTAKNASFPHAKPRVFMVRVLLNTQCAFTTGLGPDPSKMSRYPVTDFAFADTIVALDLDEAVPPSGVAVQSNGTVYVQDDSAMGAHCIVPVGPPSSRRGAALADIPGAYVMPPEQPQPPPLEEAYYQQQPQPQQTMPMDMQQMMQMPLSEDDPSLWARMRTNMKASQQEMSLLWSATASLEESHDGSGAVVYDEDPFLRAATLSRRVRRLFSFFEWDRADVLRAAWIGLAVFVLAATIGAIVLQSSSS